MITNKDLRVEGSNLIINGEKHPLDPAVDALIKRANTVQGKLSALDTRLDAIEALEKTASGNPISITGAAAAYAMGLSMTTEPIQDLHGYSKPWPAGGGKNLIDWANPSFSYSYNNSNYIDVDVSHGYIGTFHIQPNTIYTISYDIETGIKFFHTAIGIGKGTYGYDVKVRNNVYSSHIELTFSVSDALINTYGDILALRPCYYTSNVSTTFTITNFQLEVGSSATSFEPYSNICPISGLTSGVVETTDGTDTNTASITFGQTVYGGSVNFKTGEVTVTHANIASYNGESINEPWLSSLDKYESGATPTTGAQVVYPLSTPITLTLTPAELELLKGANTISGNGVTININYIGR